MPFATTDDGIRLHYEECGSGTPVYRGMIPANTSGAGYISILPFGVAFSTAITACVKTGFADNDTTAPAASAYIVNFFYK